MAEILELTEDDQLPQLSGVYADDVTGAPQDLTGYTVQLKIGYSTVLIKTATITNAAAGEFVIDFDAGDLVPGRWDCHLVFIDQSGRPLTYHDLTLVIRKKM
jgi:hypothetical protein